jgi:hypothetical protein
MNRLLPLIPLAFYGAAASAAAGNLELKIEIPRLNVAEYHRPYVALWLESPDRTRLTNLAVWYDLKMKDNEGTQWLKDLRQWWRRIGRELQMPVDGVTSATRAPGEHTITFDATKAPLKGLPPGEYRIVVEAAREVGGRELLETTFQWPAKQTQTLSLKGSHELGAVSVKVSP